MKIFPQNEIISWLLEGDVAIQYQVQRDLLENDNKPLQARIETKGWGAKYLSLRNKTGHWGRGFYQPKWTSTHYTMLDLKNLGISSRQEQIRASVNLILEYEKGEDGGLNPSRTIGESDVCINGMFLNYACYFGADQEKLKSVVDFILTQKMQDGGFNCRFNRSGAVHSSLHSTLSLAEGIHEYLVNGYTYRKNELNETEGASQEFILVHQLFLSDRTGKIIKNEFLKLSYPSRWKYDILRALDYFQYANCPYDPRMDPAINVLMTKRNSDLRWKMQAKHPGHSHFDMEQAGKPSRWNTLRAMRVLKHFNSN